MTVFSMFLVYLRGLLVPRAQLAAENLALRQQLAVLQRSGNRPMFRPGERGLWVWLARWFAEWRSWLVLGQPATVLAWHRQGFRWYWWWKSRSGRPGRSALEAEVRQLIR